MELKPQHHTIIATDVANSGSRTDPLIVRMRADLRQILEETLGRQNLSYTQLAVADLGDGYRLLLPASKSISPGVALDPFVTNLATALRLHGETSSDAHRMRLRVVIHTGLLHPEPGGAWSGGPLKECARLLDAPAARWILDAVPAADLVVVVSQTLYDSVVRHGYTLDPTLFRRIRVQVKETDEDAWAYVPGVGRPPAPHESSTPTPSPRLTPAVPLQHSSAVNIAGDGITFNGPVTGGNVNGPIVGRSSGVR